MVRATQKGIRRFSYLVALVVGAVLVVFGIQTTTKGGKVTKEEAEKNNAIVDVVYAGHPTGDGWTPGGDDDGGGGDGGGDGGDGGDDGP